MIQAVTKEFFKEKVGHPEFNILDFSLENSPIEQGVDYSTGYMPLYFYIPDYGFFVDLYGISKVAIPVTNPKEIDIQTQILNGEMDWSHWVLQRTELVRYSENEFNRVEVRGIDLSGMTGWEDREENKITSWMLNNTISGEEIRFSTKYHNNTWFGEQLRVAFENLLQIPCQIKACNERAGFISNILMKHWDEITWIK